ncbi:MAG TPA: non-canonical purine NTP pyrophosphatase, RdgB/HAM1 family [Gammaproteobacteria bacterium]|nr:non-canonical purine NTP pyrophosphatase, RdgB/HAM1 family [Gammaproteobacteria bacterium]|tara:strand:+ start:353 stop:973 length:621 start_codon:yes stop_codon:yes gene_type:complete
MVNIVLASSNRGKLTELTDLLREVPVTVVAQSDFNVPEAVENGLSFIENAIIKARNAAAFTECPALADDSGISVDALGGAPGIYSARYAGDGASDAENLEKLLADTEHVPDEQRQCRFICVVAFVRNATDPLPIVCEGIWFGRLLRAPVGTSGFGYDPIFYVPDRDSSSAELASEVKNKISHRAQALRQLVRALSEEFSCTTRFPS